MTFPALIPSSRTWTPGAYPATSWAALNGSESRVRHSTVTANGRLRLSFLVVSQSTMLGLLAHYLEVGGSWDGFTLPSAVWSGVASPGDYLPASYSWRYASPPSVVDLPCGGHDVTMELVSVVPEASVAPGADLVVRATITSTTPVTARGAALGAQVLFTPGKATGIPQVPASGATLTAAASIAGGGASSGVNVVANGATLTATASIAGGSAVSPGTAGGAALTATASIVGGGAGDLSFSSVSLLLHMDGSNNSTTFTDSSNAARSVTPYGDAKISTAQSVFGGASAFFDGSGDYLSVPYSTAFDFGTNNFTIETWFYIAGNSAPNSDGLRQAVLASCYPTGNPANGYILLLDGSSSTTGTKLYFYNVVSSVFYSVVYNATISQQAWHHVAVVRSGTTTTIYFDGALAASGTLGNQNVNAGNNNLFVGRLPFTGYLDEFNGYIDELRITKGVARYTAAFTPPTAPFPNS